MAKFLSQSQNHVLCMKPANKTVHDGIVLSVPGEHIRFNNGEYETNDKMEMDFIRNHPLFDSKITEVDGSEPKRRGQAE